MKNVACARMDFFTFLAGTNTLKLRGLFYLHLVSVLMQQADVHFMVTLKS